MSSDELNNLYSPMLRASTEYSVATCMLRRIRDPHATAVPISDIADRPDSAMVHARSLPFQVDAGER